MTEVPKIVHQRLRVAGQAAAEGTHPEADMLTAFVEQKLAQAEREGLLQHLALCGDCREAVALALPAVESSPVIVPEVESARVPVSVTVATRRNWFVWGNLRWAALAAGIAVAVLLVRPGLDHWGKQNPTVSSVAKQPALTAQQPSNSAANAESKVERDMDAKASAISDPKRQVALNKQYRQRASFERPASPAPGLGLQVADNLKPDFSRLDRAKDAPASVAAKEAPAPVARTLDKTTGVSETVEVTGAAGAASEVAVGSLVAKAKAPAIEKAKPARDEATVAQAKVVQGKKAAATATTSTAQAAFEGDNKLAAAQAASPAAMMKAATVRKQAPLWMISAGILQRSLDGGESWQTALKADHGLLCSASSGPNVWAAGQAGTVLHSSDGGTTWNAVQISSQGHVLTSDITHFEIREKEIVLATADQQTWSSADAGKTWQKK
jgi:hypothetical protein